MAYGLLRMVNGVWCMVFRVLHMFLHQKFPGVVAPAFFHLINWLEDMGINYRVFACVWCMAYGVRCMVYGVWCMLFVWWAYCIEHGLRCVMYGVSCGVCCCCLVNVVHIHFRLLYVRLEVIYLM